MLSLVGEELPVEPEYLLLPFVGDSAKSPLIDSTC